MDLPTDFVPDDQYDFIVIGGGPTASTFATLVAQAGKSCLVLEAAKFPRFAVGEIIAPTGIWRVWERLGITQEQLDERFIRKWAAGWRAPGGEFFSFEQDVFPEETACRPFVYNLDRATFDEFMLDHARSHGATALEEASVDDVLYNEDGRMNGVRFTRHGKTFEVGADLIIDASGRANFLARKLSLRTEMTQMKSFACFAHFEGALRDEGDNEGDGFLIFGDNMWWWWAPLKAPKASIGIVANREIYWDEYAADPEAYYDKYVHSNDYIQNRIKDATRITNFRPVKKGTGGAHLNHFAAYATELVGDGYCLIGDAAAFIDPIFSAGLYIVQTSAARLADEVIAAHNEGDMSKTRLKRYEDEYLTEFRDILSHVQEFASRYFQPRFVDFFVRLGNSKPKMRQLYIDTFISHDPVAIKEYSHLLKSRFGALQDEFSPEYFNADV